MAIKYEVLILRELKHMSNPCLQVLYEEWISFALESFNYGFYSIAIKVITNHPYFKAIFLWTSTVQWVFILLISSHVM